MIQMNLKEYMKISELGSYWIKIIFHIVQMAKAENITHLYYEVFVNEEKQ